MSDFNTDSGKEHSEIDIDTVSRLYGNRRTVVQAFLTAKSQNPETLRDTQLSIYELIELQLGYPIPLKLKKRGSTKDSQD